VTSPDQPDILPTLRSPDAPTLSRLFREAYDTDPFPNKVLQMLKNGTKQCKEITLAECEECENLLLYRQQISVPNYGPLKLHLMQQHHDTLIAGHAGRSKTLEYLSRTYMSYPTFKTHFKNGDSHQVMTQAIGQEPLLTTLHPLPAGSRIMGGQEKSQRHLGWGNPGQPPRLDCFQSTTEVSNAQPYPEEHTAAVDKNLEYL
jgi:hypothetical protein